MRSYQPDPVALFPVLASVQLTVRAPPDCKPDDGLSATALTCKSGYGAMVDVTLALVVVLLVSPVPLELYSTMALVESTVTVAWMSPTPAGPSGSLKVVERSRWS